MIEVIYTRFVMIRIDFGQIRLLNLILALGISDMDKGWFSSTTTACHLGWYIQITLHDAEIIPESYADCSSSSRVAYGVVGDTLLFNIPSLSPALFRKLHQVSMVF